MKKIQLDPEMLRRMHWDDNKHVIEIAKELGCARITVYRCMKEYNIPWRGLSDAAYLKASQTPPEKRKQYAQAAHDAVRGKKKTSQFLQSRSAGVETTQNLSCIEEVFLNEFRSCGLNPIPQYAITEFNVDFAFPEYRLAVEIDPGNWHQTKRKRQQDERKEEVLANLGWTTIRWSGRKINSKNIMLAQVARDHVTRLLDLLERRDIPTSPACLSRMASLQ